MILKRIKGLFSILFAVTLMPALFIGLYVLAGVLQTPAYANAKHLKKNFNGYSYKNRPDIFKPLNVTANNLLTVRNILPTGRIVTPVGLLNGTPNFATNVAVYHNLVAVVANGATFVQTVTIYNKNTLAKIAQYKAYKAKKLMKVKPPKFIIYNPKEAKNSSINKSQTFISAKNNRQDLFQGLTFGPDGTLYASGGGVSDIVALKLIGNKLVVVKKYRLKWQNFPKNQYPYQYQGRQDKKPYMFYPDSVMVYGKYIFVTGLLSNAIARINKYTGKTVYANVGPFPFTSVISDNGKRLIISDWGSYGVTVLNPVTMKKIGFIRTGVILNENSKVAGVHPTALTSVKNTPYVLVSDSNSDRIFELNSETLKVVKIINDSPYKNAPPGSYPDGIAVVKNRIYVANAGNDDIAVYDLKTGSRIGLIPTAWYPTAVVSSGNDIFVVSAKGLGSGPDYYYQWIGSFMDGVIQKVNLNYIKKDYGFWTHVALKDNGFTLSQRTARHEKNAKIDHFLRTHIKHVVFILRENKTFDEDLGVYKRAGKWADPHLDLYNKRELPNLYKLVNDYGLFVNFMADGQVTSQAHEWTTGASDSDWIQRTWPIYYSGRGLVENSGWTTDLRKLSIRDHYKYMPIYDSLAALKHWSNPWVAYPQKLYIFNNMIKYGVSFEDFGEFVSRSRIGNISNVMKKHIDLKSYGWDRFVLDTTRTNVFLNFAKKRMASHDFPSFVYIWLPDDHTAGTKSCYYTPDYYVANNDYATGKIIDYLSHSPIWKNTLVFITEDDAQSGADHINALRTFAVMIGPYAKKGALISHFYSQVNILKTIEAIFKLPPMSQWDANSAVIRNGFTDKPDMAPFNVLPMKVKPALNPGICRSKIDKLRLELGKKGLWEVPLKSKLKNKFKLSSVGVASAGEQYTPVTLMKVSGPEQFKQEWIASKGLKSYKKVIGYIKKLTKKEHRPAGSILEGVTPD